MNRRDILGTAVGSLLLSAGISSADDQRERTGDRFDGRSARNPVEISTGAVQSARTHARGLLEEAHGKDLRGVGRSVAQRQNKAEQYLTASEDIASNWSALTLARKAAVNATLVNTATEVDEGTLSADDVRSEASQASKKLERKISAVRSTPRSNEDLVVLAEMHRSLNAAGNHLEQIEKLINADGRPRVWNLAQARGSVQSTLMNISDSEYIADSNRRTLDHSDGSVSVEYDDLVFEAEALVDAQTVSQTSFDSVAIETPEGYLDRSEAYRSKGLEAGAIVAALKAVSFAKTVDTVEDIPNPWETSGRVKLADVENDKETAVSEIGAQDANGPLGQVILHAASEYVSAGDDLFAQAEIRNNIEDSEALVLANAKYRIAAGLANTADSL